MSLINQVLKGLDSRKHTPEAMGLIGDLQWVNSEPSKPNYILIGALVLGFVSLSAGSMLGIQWLYEHAVFPSPATDSLEAPELDTPSLTPETTATLYEPLLAEAQPMTPDLSDFSDHSLLMESRDTDIIMRPPAPTSEPLVLGEEANTVPYEAPPIEPSSFSLPKGANRIHEFRYSNTEHEARLVFELDDSLAHELEVSPDLLAHALFLPDVFLMENQKKVIEEFGLIRKLSYQSTDHNLKLAIETRVPTTIYSYFLAPDERYAHHRLVFDLMARSNTLKIPTSLAEPERHPLETALAQAPTISPVAVQTRPKTKQPAKISAPMQISAKPAPGSASKNLANNQMAKSVPVYKSSSTTPATVSPKNVIKTEQQNTLRTANRAPRKLQVEDVAERHYQHALKLLGQQQLEDAMTLLQKALEQDPNHTKAREQWLDILMRTGRLSEAENGLREALIMHPKHSAFAKLYARILVERNNIGGAIYILENALPAVADDAEYHAFLAAMYQRQGEHEKAVELYQSVVTENPFNGVWWMGLAISQEHIRQPDQAIKNYNQALYREGLSPELADYIHSRLKQLQIN